MRKQIASAGVLAVTLLAGEQAMAQATQTDEIPADPTRNVYFGELHLHTSYSLDSYIFGNRNDPDTAYRFGRGEPVKLYGGGTKQLAHPLDFMAVTDHSEYLGEIGLCTTPGSPVYDTKICDGIRRSDPAVFTPVVESVNRPDRRHVTEICGDGAQCREAAKGTWKKIQDAAARYNQPGKFTTLVGYEYSPSVPTADGRPYVPGTVPGMLHRNVIFRTDTVPDNVFSSYDGSAEQLQAWLEANCKEPCRVLVIPHNSNYSWGHFFWERNSDGSPWTKEILERRARIEPLVEVFQIKGGSECQAGVGLTDEECGFENSVPVCKPGQTEACAGPGSFVRDALVHGLSVDEKWGVNPFKYGLIGSTDNHDALSGSTDEKSWTGAHGGLDNTPEKRLATQAALAQGHDPDGDDDPVSMMKFNPGGLAGVWAEKNTRESIWDALYRRETFGTSGTRIRVRFFGSFDFPADLHKSADLVRIGYAKGVPMGGDLKAAPAGKAPRFLVWATRDPDSAPLQKIQIIKGWIENGKSVAKVYDVACSNGIKADPRTGTCADNGAKVDIATCAIAPGKGAAELSTTWTDPAFDPKIRAVYYVRVLEDPVCRWSTYDAHRLKVDPPKQVPPTIKERAWTSPIWYTPG